MDTASLPAWAQTLYLVVTVAGAAALAVWQGRKAANKSSPEIKSEGTVLAASFMDKQTLTDLRTAVANLDGTMRELCVLVEAVKHDMEIERAVRAEMARRAAER